MIETNERVTVDFDSESYYLDGEYWESWDNYGEEMADKINELLNKLHEEKEQLKSRINDYNVALKTLQDLTERKLKENEQLKEENKELKQENVNIMGDLDYYRAKSGSCEEGLFQNDKEIAKLKKENKELKAENEQLQTKIRILKGELDGKIVGMNLFNAENTALMEENEQLKQQIKDLRIDVLDSIHEADEIQCTCNPCIVEECVKKVVE